MQHSKTRIPKPKINLPPITNHDERYPVEGSAVLGHGFEGMLGLAQWLSKFVQFFNNAPPVKVADPVSSKVLTAR